MSGALLGAGVGASVSPFSQSGLDEAFGLAVGARRVRAGKAMADAETMASIAEEPRAIARAVVGQQTTNVDAEGAVVSDRSMEESHGGVAAFIGQDLREGEAGVVVDGDVNELPAGAATALGLVGGNAMTGAEEAAELLDVEMQQIAGAGMFVAAHGPSRFEIADTTEAFAVQNAADGSGREADSLGDVSVGPTLAAQRNDALDQGPRGPSRAAVRSRGTIVQTGDALAAVTRQPLVDGSQRDATGRRGVPWRLLLGEDALDDPHSHIRRQSCILVDVHSVSPSLLLWDNSSFPGPGPNEQPSETSQLAQYFGVSPLSRDSQTVVWRSCSHAGPPGGGQIATATN